MKSKKKNGRYYKKKQQTIFSAIALAAIVAFLIYGSTIAPTSEIKCILLAGAGVIIVAFAAKLGFARAKRAIHDARYARSPLSRIDKMSGEEFEVYLESMFRQQGYHAERVGGSYDYGADLLLKRDGQTIAVQAKHYKGKVGNQAVQQVVAAKNYYKADRYIVVTNSYFTKAASELADANEVKLIDRNWIKSWIK